MGEIQDLAQAFAHSVLESIQRLATRDNRGSFGQARRRRDGFPFPLAKVPFGKMRKRPHLHVEHVVREVRALHRSQQRAAEDRFYLLRIFGERPRGRPSDLLLPLITQSKVASPAAD